jgi:hypothetical protein
MFGAVEIDLMGPSRAEPVAWGRVIADDPPDERRIDTLWRSHRRIRCGRKTLSARSDVAGGGTDILAASCLEVVAGLCPLIGCALARADRQPGAGIG